MTALKPSIKYPPPPLVEEMFLNSDGHTTGPFPGREVLQMWLEGKISPATLYWFEGMPQWLQISRGCWIKEKK